MPSVEEIERRIDGTVERYPWLVLEGEDAVAGYAYAGEHRSRDAYRWSVDSSVYVHEDHRRAGIARGLYTSLFEILRLQGFVNVYAGITLPNRVSVDFHRSMGFEPVGTYEDVGYKRGEWRDVQWWHRQLDEPRADPAPPTPLPDVRSRRTWDDALSAGSSSVEL